MSQPKHNQVFDPATIPPLLEKAKAGDIESRDFLLHMFERLITTLVGACLGRVNRRSSYCKTFLLMFTRTGAALSEHRGDSLETVAAMLKHRLRSYEKNELRDVCRLAVLQAIEDCRENLASTIVIKFHENIVGMLSNGCEVEMREFEDQDPRQANPEDEMLFEMFMNSLPEDEWKIAALLIDGEYKEKDHGAIPESLKRKLAEYVEKELPDWVP